MRTIVFYGRDGAAAKARAKEIVRSRQGRAIVYDVAAWGGTKDNADGYEIMDCVSYFDRERIEYVFGKSDTQPIETVEEIKGDIRIPKKRGRKPKAVA